MNLPTPSQRFNKKESGLDTVVETVATVSMQIAAKKAKDVSGHSDIPVAIDGGTPISSGCATGKAFYTMPNEKPAKCEEREFSETKLGDIKPPPYNPDHSPRDFHLFGPLKKLLDGQNSRIDAEVQQTVWTWFLRC
ncbi:hypothetical protein TNCV_3036271 [Trichonephila clavipes]|nr:hypothetical protein TNCV_3036271 [Trichonephila clavipes]